MADYWFLVDTGIDTCLNLTTIDKMPLLKIRSGLAWAYRGDLTNQDRQRYTQERLDRGPR